MFGHSAITPFLGVIQPVSPRVIQAVSDQGNETHYRGRIYQKAMSLITRGGGLGSRPKKMYGERLGDGVEYHLMRPTPRC